MIIHSDVAFGMRSDRIMWKRDDEELVGGGILTLNSTLKVAVDEKVFFIISSKSLMIASRRTF